MHHDTPVLLLLDELWLGCELYPLDPLELDELDELDELPALLELLDPLDPLDPLDDELVALDELEEPLVVVAVGSLWSVRFQTAPKSATEATASVQRALRRVAPRLASAWTPAERLAVGVARVTEWTPAGAATPSSAMVTSPSGCATQLSTKPAARSVGVSASPSGFCTRPCSSLRRHVPQEPARQLKSAS
jgi:hypothetical protein